MTKVIGMLVALAVFCAMPAVAFADHGGGHGYGDTVSSGDAVVRGGDVTGDGYDGGGSGGDVGVGCAISQAAGGNATATNNCGNTNVQGAGEGEGDEECVGGAEEGVGGDVTGVGGGDVGGGVGGGGVGGVTLARTGFDAWLLAVIGGLSLAGGLGLLAAQRRGRIGG
jgi:hypothetical protein